MLQLTWETHKFSIRHPKILEKFFFLTSPEITQFSLHHSLFRVLCTKSRLFIFFCSSYTVSEHVMTGFVGSRPGVIMSRQAAMNWVQSCCGRKSDRIVRTQRTVRIAGFVRSVELECARTSTVGNCSCLNKFLFF